MKFRALGAILCVLIVAPAVQAETAAGADRLAASERSAAERQPESLTGVLIQARGGPATTGGFLAEVTGPDKGIFASDCCVANGGLGCDTQSCEDTVCAADSFCCDTQWDGVCASEALSLCPVVCAVVAGGGDCCSANGTPGCDDVTCQTDVCAADSFCCDVEWDGICATAAATLCPVVCQATTTDLSLVKTVLPPGGQLLPGSSVVYEITATNNGPEDAIGVVVNDDIPFLTEWVGDSCGAGPAAGNVLVWNIGSLAADESVSCQVTVRFVDSRSYFNEACVSHAGVDTVPENDCDIAEVFVGRPVIPTLSPLGLGLLVLVLAGSAGLIVRRRRRN